jgi:ABC-2 type transport system ATP-binding protein
MTTIRAEGLIKRQGDRFRLGPVDLQVRAGEVLGVMGPNGAGKTTLLKLMWGFLRPDQGSVLVFQQQTHLHHVSVRLRAGYLSESPSFYGWMTARMHLEFVSQFYEGWDQTRTLQLMERFNIDPSLRLRQMSRGSRLKVALIAAVSHRPGALLLDEPTAGLDPIVRRDVLQFFRDLSRNEGVSLILSSHISHDLDTLSDSVLMLDDGHVLQYSTTDALIRSNHGRGLEDIFLEVAAKNHSHRPGIHP